MDQNKKYSELLNKYPDGYVPISAASDFIGGTEEMAVMIKRAIYKQYYRQKDAGVNYPLEFIKKNPKDTESARIFINFNTALQYYKYDITGFMVDDDKGPNYWIDLLLALLVLICLLILGFWFIHLFF